jgi:two-component system, LytTR family, response regulator
MIANCLIADDEPLAVELLKKYVLELGTLKLAGTCSNAMEVSSFLHHNQVDLLFLDIQMPKLTGIELLKVLKSAPSVIITTAHREYALEGYEFDVVDYLLKPITFERFVASIEKFYLRKKNSLTIPSAFSKTTQEKFILLKSGTKTHQINIDIITYIESQKDFIKINFDDGKKMLVKYQIGQLEVKLPPDFIRVHRSYIINKKKITTFTSTHIEMGNFSIPIGQNYKSILEDSLGLK